MCSRIRENPKRLFDCWCEVAPQSGNQSPFILQKYPDSYNDQEVLKSVPQFTFPCEVERSTAQHFSFVLTSADSKWTFGFCRHSPYFDPAVVILSALPWHEVFYKILNHLSELMCKKEESSVLEFLDVLYNHEIPPPCSALHIPIANKEFFCECPDYSKLPSIPNSRNLTEYMNAVDPNNMIEVFASMLFERRIVVVSKRLCRLSACVQAANALIAPMNWQHIFIPVLPRTLKDYLSAPMPFLIGVPSSIMEFVRSEEIGDVVILDADMNVVKSPFNDHESLPEEVVQGLRRRLKTENQLGDSISRAFLKALVQLIGGYRDALRFRQGEKITFSEDAFLTSRPPHIQPFLEKMLQLQLFQQFIEERLEILNSGQGFSDDFELEACSYSEKSASGLKQQYQEWVTNMRRGGGAFVKTVKNKANPAVKGAMKSVRYISKNANRAIKTKFRELGDRTTDEAHSAPSSPQESKKRNTFTMTRTGMTGLRADRIYRRQTTSPTSMMASRQQRDIVLDNDPLSPSAELEADLHSLSMDLKDLNLLGEMQKMFPPPVDRSLKPTRSLESMSDMGEASLLQFSPTSDDEPELAPLSISIPKPRRRTSQDVTSQGIREKDLIRLDSEPEMIFDPLLAGGRRNSSSSRPPGVQNPSYELKLPQSARNNVHSSMFVPRTKPTPSPSTTSSASTLKDMELLKEYGIDFSHYSTCPGNAQVKDPFQPETRPSVIQTDDPFGSGPFGMLSPSELQCSTSNQSTPSKSKTWTTFD